MELCERLKLLREKTGLGQQEFAERVGVSRSTQIRYENGYSDPPLDYIQRLASEYGVDSRWLMTGVEESEVERLAYARHQVLGRIIAELGLSYEQFGLLVDWAFERDPKWVEMARAMVSSCKLAALSPAEIAIVEAYRAANDSGKKALEATAAVVKEN